ncbi:class I SAM-dependent methyltransferase [Specibacter cremeus]|uniref:class I SAM-dependent methyltransferase n=1 Tax=Specibacter cremeus TaxID=1629051 RepID=UPI00197BD511|nr:SAM-dependent methyltransferase [Specibacter cremeus]
MDASWRRWWFRAIQAVYLPLTAVGMAWLIGKALVHARRTGESATALASLYTRYMQHQLGVRRDVTASGLMTNLPNVSRPALRLASAATLLGHKVTGHVPQVYAYPYRVRPGQEHPSMRHEATARTTYIDEALDETLDAGRNATEQLVILGAGNDTRCYGLPDGAPPRCFEVDAPATQALKRRMLDSLGVASGHVTFVSTDFLHEDWLEGLVAAGFDPSVRTFFVWEGVTMYLDREAVTATLRRIAAGAAGTTVAFDYLSPRMLGSDSAVYRYSRAALAAAGEPMRFALGGSVPAREEVRAFLADCGLTLGVHHIFGAEAPGRPAFAGFATAIVPAQGRGRHRGPET